MGTNFYTNFECFDGKHIGKLISGGAGNGQTFIWDQNPVFVIKVCLDNPIAIIAYDGAKAYTGKHFLDLMLDPDLEHDFSQIGMDFG